MSDEIAIRAEQLGKKYVIGHQAERERYVALRDVLARGAWNAIRKTSDLIRGRAIVTGDTVEEFWALKNVSFEVKRGEVVGIIGRNGAGKSTLLKILSRITEPSEGRVTIHGSVASLLELGTGFHPELTGRENIYLNGAILGMKRAEIKRKFDEIVAFAEIEKFLDTPVKRYSTGMYLRLAFAVAAHLEPEILVVDEVLAVGDAEFQKKCLGKMSEVAGRGRTVLFVSHNMDALLRVCGTGLLLASGRIEMRGEADKCVEHYLRKPKPGEISHVLEFTRATIDRPHVTRIEVLDEKGMPLLCPKTWDYVKFRIFFRSQERIKNASVVLYISTVTGTLLSLCSTSPDSACPMDIEPGEHFVDCDFPNLMLSAGSFIIGGGLAIPNVEWLDNQPHATRFQVEARDVFNSGLAPIANRYPVPMPHIWRTTKANESGSGPVGRSRWRQFSSTK
jgi:lipopolysaccharide transport system ATP-binding protein